MKRKHEEGYALVYSLVVLLVLSAVAMAIMAFAGRDLKAQQASIDRMKDQYAAQGKVEIIVAQLDAVSDPDDFYSICTDAQPIPNEGASGDYTATIQVIHVGEKYDVTIDCALRLTKPSGETTYRVEYISYSISSEKQPDPVNGGGG